MSLSPLVSFKSRFVTYLLNFPRRNTVKTKQIYYTLPLSGYMFRLLRVIIRPSNELTQDFLGIR